MNKQEDIINKYIELNISIFDNNKYKIIHSLNFKKVLIDITRISNANAIPIPIPISNTIPTSILTSTDRYKKLSSKYYINIFDWINW
jgi:hypothetical protein